MDIYWNILKYYICGDTEMDIGIFMWFYLKILVIWWINNNTNWNTTENNGIDTKYGIKLKWYDKSWLLFIWILVVFGDIYAVFNGGTANGDNDKGKLCFVFFIGKKVVWDCIVVIDWVFVMCVVFLFCLSLFQLFCFLFLVFLQPIDNFWIILEHLCFCGITLRPIILLMMLLIWNMELDMLLIYLVLTNNNNK